ncbi:hypothetical protein KOW79_013526 [Hemibagrus wyckioides]|uniref:Uncharacterized protein n=1 Tax=Hemibagrus wyckioides TaxID=337641 RepID=A0A9D3SLP2_9TELE|nr:hypothetical protein KOW79_013526 [Hemibagrus wyckioides]
MRLNPPAKRGGATLSQRDEEKHGAEGRRRPVRFDPVQIGSEEYRSSRVLGFHDPPEHQRRKLKIFES